MSKEPKLKDGAVGREIVDWFIKNHTHIPIAAKLYGGTNNPIKYELTFEDRQPGLFEFILKPQGLFHIESVKEL